MTFTKKIILYCLLLISTSFINIAAFSQMRLIRDNNTLGDDIYGISFYSASEGFIAYNQEGLGYTTDSGRTITIKPFVNIDTNGYHHDFQGADFDLSSFYLYGLYTKGPDKLFVYGFSPNTSNAFILYSADKGNSFKVVYYQLYDSENFGDMSFPQNGNTGFVRSSEHILKTIDGGMNWFDINTSTTSYFNALNVLNNNTLFLSTSLHELFKSSDGGTTWQLIPSPPASGPENNVHFISLTKGWVNNYYTNNGGTTWTLSPYRFANLNAMTFINDSTGFVVGADHNIYKTTDTANHWEKVAKQNYTTFEYPGYYKNIYVANNQLWFSMGTYLAINTNIGAASLPTAIFSVDTVASYSTGIIKLQNHSKTNYTYKWFVNNVLISTNYSTSYTRTNKTTIADTIMLIVNNGVITDTMIQIPALPIPTIGNFTPATSSFGETITINGTNFTGAMSVSFGGIPAHSFKVVSPTKITAVVSNSSSGMVSVATPMGIVSKAGFTFVPGATITSFYPNIVGPGDTLTIIGTNFITNNAYVTTAFGGAMEVVSITQTKYVCLVAHGEQGYKGRGVSLYDGQTNLLVTALDTITFDATPQVYTVTPLIAKAGDIVTITGKYLAPGGGGPIEPTVTFGGATSGTVTATSFSSITAVVVNGASGNIVVTNTFGVSGNYPGFIYKNSICPNGSTAFISHLSGSSYQWQVNAGSGFNNISNNANYSGTSTQTLSLVNIPSTWSGYQYRCVVNGVNTGVYNLGFENKWTNPGIATWENTSNWSCSNLPDANTDVTINSGTITINSNAICRSITVSPNAKVTVSTGATLTITH